ncbi:MAG: HPF/RaiA family ribosome-associated protein [Nakamurella sp.]
MQILVNTDSNVSGREELADRVTATVQARLERFADHLTRVEVHLADESAGRTTGADHRCTIEARPAGRQPIAVTAHAATVDESVASAVGKLMTVLGREHDRHDHHKGSASIRTGAGEDGAAADGDDLDTPPDPEADPAQG